MSFLLDTNVVSELRKGLRCNPRVAGWFAGIDDADVYLSVLVVGELRQGIERLRDKDPRQSNALERWLVEILAAHVDRILDIDRAVAEEWGRLAARRTVSVIDGLLAATARTHGLTLATRNVKHFAATGVAHFDPFAAA